MFTAVSEILLLSLSSWQYSGVVQKLVQSQKKVLQLQQALDENGTDHAERVSIG